MRYARQTRSKPNDPSREAAHVGAPLRAVLASAACRCGGATRLALALLLLALALLYGRVPPAAAQSKSPDYWEYSASDRLHQASAVDVDGDGVDEVLVADDNATVALIAADGQVLWTYRPDQPLDVITTANLNGGGDREIVLAGEDSVIALTMNGSLLWRESLQRGESGSVFLGEKDQVDVNGAVPLASVRPVAAAPYDGDGDGLEDVVVLVESGSLVAFGPSGGRQWQLATQEGAVTSVQPQMLVSDFDGDGKSEIAISIFTPRRFSQVVFVDDEAVAWRQSVSRRVTSLAAGPFESGRTGIAVGTNFGQIDLYAPSGERLWFRTVNRPVTALAFATLQGEPLLLAGTDAGSVIAFTYEGRRKWVNNLSRAADRRVLSLMPTDGRTSAGQSGVAVVLESGNSTTDLADLLLLSATGQSQSRLGETDLPEVTALVDLNHDRYPELLLARFATLQLQGLGVGDSEYIQEWAYGLESAPQAVLFLDLDNDGEEEILVGTQDGRLHALGSNQVLRWLHAPGNEITHLAALRPSPQDRPQIAIARRLLLSDPTEETTSRGWVELRDAEGELLWEVEAPEEITALSTELVGPDDEPLILAGTVAGNLLAFGPDGVERWRRSFEELEGGIRHLRLVPGSPNRSDLLLVGGERDIEAITLPGNALVGSPYARYEAPITGIYTVAQPGSAELSVRVVVFIEDGSVHGLNWRGIEMAQWPWPHDLEGSPRFVEATPQGAIEAFQDNLTAFLVATDDARLSQLNVTKNQPEPFWSLDQLDGAEALYWDDLDKDGRPDTALVGTDNGEVRLYKQLQTRDPQLALDLNLGSAVFDLSLVQRSGSQSPELFTVTNNGQVQLYREEVNRPPLLSQPEMVLERGQYAASVNVHDVEGDPVKVRLELYDPVTASWQGRDEEELQTGNGPLFWPGIQAPDGATEMRYRFRFDDGFYRGYLTPAPGPAVPPPAPLTDATPWLLGLLSLVLAGGAALFVQQSRAPNARARRFYGQLSPEPAQTLTQIERQYEQVSGSPDFLLQLANRARQKGDNFVSGIADGLFLLPSRPQAGLSIIVRTLDEAHAVAPDDGTLNDRRQLYATAQSLLEAPSLTELSLLRPQLVHLLAVMEEHNRYSPIVEGLLPALTNMRDSERVDSVDDRLVYLNQASVRLRQMQELLPEFSPTVERALVRIVSRRWSGLVSAEIEEQRGRAELQVLLMTRRIVPNGHTHVAVEIRNSGRAPAENVIATLEQDPAYRVIGEPQVIPFLPSGRSRQVRFQVEPQVADRFRIALSLSYDDRNQRDRTMAFGDMVSLLPPVREFRPIPNPYLPGTPLRRESPLFYGREELFDFIAENAGGGAQRNVMMLVGQRRTGKTSALLRLEEHLPSNILPVYIDCQSLGVTPGMPALLQELAWHICDALAARGLRVDVPEIEAWERDPARLFQRTFLPGVRAVLPPGSTLLLVFDEFEAFEAMVADGILPPTFFTYMRHLMQHSDGLSFIFVGARRLEEMGSDYWSVLFNIALYRKIDYLSHAAATRLICEPVAPVLVYDDLAVDKVLRVTAGHPYFLQLVCYTLVKRANQEKRAYMTISDVNAALDEMLRLGEVHFAYLWQRSSYAERALLTAVAHLTDRNEPLHPEQLTDYLHTFSIELAPPEVTNALNSLVERDILREVTEEGKTLYELRIGLVGLWVSRNKSLSKLYAYQES